MDYILISIYIAVCLLLTFVENKIPFSKSISIYIFFALVFSITFAIRDVDTTHDTANYVEIFNLVSTSDGLFTSVDRYEPGFCFINRVVKIIYDDYKFLFFVISFCVFLLWLFVLKLTSEYLNKFDNNTCQYSLYTIRIYPLTFFSVYICYFGLLYNSIALRAGIELVLLYVSILLCLNKRYLFSIIVYLITITIHQTAILAFPILLLAYKNIRFTKKVAFVFWGASLIMYMIGIRQFSASFAASFITFLSYKVPGLMVFSWADHYISDASADYGFSLLKFSYFILSFFLIYNEKDKYINFFTSLTLISLFLSSLFGTFTILNRFTEIFLIAICLALTVNIYNIKNVKISLNSRKFIFIVMAMFVFYYGFLSNIVLNQ